METKKEIYDALKKWIEARKKEYVGEYNIYAPSAYLNEQSIKEDAKLEVLQDLEDFIEDL